MAPRNGLVPVQRTVTRHGVTFQTTVWIKPKHSNSVQHGSHVQVPTWNFSSSADLKNEVDRINKVKDRSERRILKENLLDHIENHMGVKWQKVADNEDRAFARNTMKALSAAKKHLDSQPATPAQPAPSQPAQQAPAGNGKMGITKQPGKDYVMDRDTSKKMARDFRDQHGMDEVVKMLKDNGITWNEVPDAGPNNMRALRALASFMRKGGQLGATAQATPQQNPAQPAPVLNNPNQPMQKKSKYEKDSIQHDYEQAKPHHKLIGLATGVMPLDDETATYLKGLIDTGQMGLLGEDGGGADYKLPKALNNELDPVISSINRGENHLGDQASFLYAKQMFEGTQYEANFKEYEKSRDSFKTKYREKADEMMSEGVKGIEASKKLLEALNEVDKDWLDLSGEDFLEELHIKIGNLKGKSDTEIDEAWDKYGMDDLFAQGRTFMDSNHSIIEVLVRAGITNANAFSTVESMLTGPGQTNMASIRQALVSGSLTKRQIFARMENDMGMTISLRGSSQPMTNNLAKRWNTGATGLLQQAVHEHVHGPVTSFSGSSQPIPFKQDEFLKMCDEALADLAPMKTPEGQHVEYNIQVARGLRYAYDFGNIKRVPHTPVPMDDFLSGRSNENIIKTHIGAERQKSEKSKQNYINKVKEKQNKNFGKILRDGVDPTKVDFPDAADVKEVVKTTLMKVDAAETAKVAANVARSHDNANHGSFRTKVHGVYRVKRISSEEKYQKVSKDIGNEGFYYHGTSFDTAQKILGMTGGFKVFTAADGNKIKAGSMLGYGIYLAKQSSKSMQYVGSGFRSGSRGVLFVCKAALGNVVQTRSRGCAANQPIMNRASTDTVFMDKPDVINPEWAVKRAEQAVPRLWIDAERV